MATTTTHYGFTKPGVNDYVDISVLNANFDNLDNVIYNNQLSAQTALDDIAPEYDATATYSVGDYVTYNKTLYRCTTAIATAEAFDDTKWTAVKVGGELKSHDARISDLEAGVELEGSATNSFNDGIDSYFKKVKSTIVPVQAGSGTPSPTNVRAISGFTECKVTDTNGTDTNTATISFGSAGTVYGGYVDLISGKLVVDKVGEVIKGSGGSWDSFAVGTKSATARYQLSYFAKRGETSSSTVGAISSTGVEAPRYWYSSRPNELPGEGDMCFAMDTNYVRFYMTDTTIADITAFKNAFIDTTLVYPLVTPIEYQLTPAQLRSLVGANNLTSSTGEVTEVEYITNKTIAWLLDLIMA